jgi:hypothetical protein
LFFSSSQNQTEQNIILILLHIFAQPDPINIIIMHFSTPLTIFLSLTGALAVPIKLSKKAAVGTSAAVLKVQTYDEFNISGGVAGNALAEVAAAFPVRLALPLHKNDH